MVDSSFVQDVNSSLNRSHYRRLLLDACLAVILSEQIKPDDLSERRICLIRHKTFDVNGLVSLLIP